MKRYLLFSGSGFYPYGGWGDFQDDFGSLDEAKEQVRQWMDVEARRDWWEPRIVPEHDWWHVVDTETQQVVAEGSR